MINLKDSCVAQYKMNDKATNKTVVDSQLFSDGTAQQNTSAMAATGKVNGALSFNGTSDRVDPNATFQSILQSDFTICALIKPNDGQPPTEGDHRENDIMGCLAADSFTGVELWHYADGLGKGLITAYYAMPDGGQVSLTPATSLMADGAQDWHWICWEVYQNGNKISGNLYFDNALKKYSQSLTNKYMSNYASTLNPTIGSTNHNGSFLSYAYFDGLMDNLMIFNRRLTSDERNFLWNSGNGTEDLTDIITIPSQGSGGVGRGGIETLFASQYGG